MWRRHFGARVDADGSVIEDLKDASDEDLAAQIAFLRHPSSPVKWAGDGLADGTYKLQTGSVRDVEWLGDQTSIFSNLDGLYAYLEVGLEKFRVRDVRSMLVDDRCDDHESRERLAFIEQGLQIGTLDPNITFLAQNGLIIIDGNKTAAALYHLKTNEPGLDVRIYLMSRAD